MANLVEVRDLRVEARTDSGRRVEIIRGVDLDIAPGEVLALIGESGSGKTTIALSLMGHLRPGCRIVGGSVRVDGKDMAALSQRELGKLRGTTVAYIPQSAAAAFNPAQTLMQQVIEVAQIHALMPAAEARARAVALFRDLALPKPETIGERYPHQVSGGQLQRASAAMALIGSPKLVIFDELTTALDVTTQIEVLRAFKKMMRLSGAAGVYVSHDLAVVAQIADRIMVLKDGQTQEVGPSERILSAPAHPYTRILLAAVEPKPAPPRVDDPAMTPRRPLLEVEQVVAGYGPIGADGQPATTAVKAVSLSLERGHNFGIIGESGCGKSTLARVISGILKPSAGRILFDGRTLAPDLRQRSREDLRRLQIVFQLADTALNPSKSVGEIIGRPLAFYHGRRGRENEARVEMLLDMVQLPRSARHRLACELSGGQKQRVNLARALAAEPEVVICDEITSALDTVVTAAIIELLRDLQRELGLSYIFISHDLSMVRSICDRIAVMYHGEKVAELAPDAFGASQTHPYARRLYASMPKLDRNWLDSLDLAALERAESAPAEALRP